MPAVRLPPQLALYLVHWNAADRLVRSVESLLASTEVDLQLTVVDNGSAPEVIAYLQETLPASVELLLLPENRGYCGAANVALRARLEDVARSGEQAREVLVAVAAHDVVVRPDALARLAEAARSEPAYGVLGPAHHGRDPAGPVDWIGGRFRGAAGAPFAPPPPDLDPERVVDVDWVPGLLMVFRAACLQEAGLFDEQLFAYWEDVDLCLRARRAGWGVGVVPGAAAADQGYSAGFFNQSYYVARNCLLVVGKHLGRRRRNLAAGRLAWRTLTAYAGSIVPTRSADHRARSRAYAAGRWAGLRDGLRGRGGAAQPWSRSSRATPWSVSDVGSGGSATR